MVNFKSKQKYFKRLYTNESVKYLGVKSDTNISWQFHVHELSIKLNRANALLFKIRKNVSLKILRSIYFATFDSCLSYCCLVQAQYRSTIQRVLILEKMKLELSIFSQGIPILVPYSNKTPSQNFKIKPAQKIFYLLANL